MGYDYYYMDEPTYYQDQSSQDFQYQPDTQNYYDDQSAAAYYPQYDTPVQYTQQVPYQAPPSWQQYYEPAPDLSLPTIPSNYGSSAAADPFSYLTGGGSSGTGALDLASDPYNYPQQMLTAAGMPQGYGQGALDRPYDPQNYSQDQQYNAFTQDQYDQAARNLVPGFGPAKQPGFWDSLGPQGKGALITALGGLGAGILGPTLAALFRPKPPALPTPGQLGLEGGGSEASSHPSGIGGVHQVGGYLGFPGTRDQFAGLTPKLAAERDKLPEITQESIIQQAQSLFDKVLAPQIIADSQKRIDAINEMANRLGLNAAGPIAQEMDNRARQLDAARTQSQQTALAYAQSLISAGNARLSSGLSLAGLLNPAQYAGPFASVFNAPITESSSG